MTPGKINELIPEIHEEEKRRGEWDGVPSWECTECEQKKGYYDGIPDCDHFYGDDHGHMSCRIGDENRSHYLATKIDLITEALVDAMRARRKGRKCIFVDGHKIEIIDMATKHYLRYYHFNALGTYEHHLALALKRMMDLMGFYGFAHKYSCDKFCKNDIMTLFRHTIVRSAAEARSEIHSNIDAELSTIVSNILRIAELDNIDLGWHLDALRKYLKKAVQAYENNELDEFTLKHILQDAAMIFTHAALTGKVRNFRH